MFEFVRRLLVDLSVGKKLLCGFGLVLFLTIAVMGTGFFALNSVLGQYRQVMQGMISGFGTYTVDGDTVTIKWIASSYPNRSGTTEKRTYKVSGDELSSTNPTAASGGVAHTKLVRAK